MQYATKSLISMPPSICNRHDDVLDDDTAITMMAKDNTNKIIANRQHSLGYYFDDEDFCCKKTPKKQAKFPKNSPRDGGLLSRNPSVSGSTVDKKEEPPKKRTSISERKRHPSHKERQASVASRCRSSISHNSDAPVSTEQTPKRRPSGSTRDGSSRARTRAIKKEEQPRTERSSSCRLRRKAKRTSSCKKHKEKQEEARREEMEERYISVASNLNKSESNLRHPRSPRKSPKGATRGLSKSAHGSINSADSTAVQVGSMAKPTLGQLLAQGEKSPNENTNKESVSLSKSTYISIDSMEVQVENAPSIGEASPMNQIPPSASAQRSQQNILDRGIAKSSFEQRLEHAKCPSLESISLFPSRSLDALPPLQAADKAATPTIQQKPTPLEGRARMTRSSPTRRQTISLPIDSASVRKKKAIPPDMWCITYNQLMQVETEAKKVFGEPAVHSKTMRDICREIIEPTCRKTGTSFALSINKDGLPMDVFVTHCWDGQFTALVQQIRNAFQTVVLKPNLWICAFALVQGKDVSLQIGCGKDPLENAPFVQALRSASAYCIVRNSHVDVYSRIWCVCELIYAQHYGLFPAKTYVTGPDAFPEQSTVLDAKASRLEDRDRILRVLLNDFKRELVDDIVQYIRTLNAPTQAPQPAITNHE